MSNMSFNFKIGAFDCQVIADGTLKIPGHEQMELTCLFIRTGKHNVLIDAGEGKGINPTSGYLIENMKAAGISPTDVDRVIITHGHLDHVGGLVDEKGKPVYPNALYVMHKKEWDYWKPILPVKPGEAGKNESMLVATAKKRLIAIQDRINVFGDESEIVPGIRYVLMPGHTPGNTMVVISSGKDQILCVGDIMHGTEELTEADSWAQFDMNTAEAMHSRAKFLSEAAATKALVFVCHFPFPGVGYIRAEDGHFAWEPMVK
jgi:glyoxylase-like metal-dependent hydrolase (beta-lactamase superfamily II)